MTQSNDTANDTLIEQLSAYMDGELPEAEARFLQRRLEHDDQLRAKWARMQLASTCIKGQPWVPMRESLAMQVRAGLGQTPPARIRRPLVRWAVAASVAALAVMFAPRMLQNSSAPTAVANSAQRSVQTSAQMSAQTSEPSADHVLASPASADLVALQAPAAGEGPTANATSRTHAAGASEFVASNSGATAKESPLPLSTQSPTDFPLVDSGDKRSWPRSQVVGGANDPSLEAYLVRHNQMLANDGLGGFVPYVDVVTQRPASADEQNSSAQDGEANPQ